MKRTMIVFALVLLPLALLPMASMAAQNACDCQAPEYEDARCSSVMSWTGTQTQCFCRHGDEPLPLPTWAFVECPASCNAVTLTEGYCCTPEMTDEECDHAPECDTDADCLMTGEVCREISELYGQGCRVTQTRTWSGFGCTTNCNAPPAYYGN